MHTYRSCTRPNGRSSSCGRRSVSPEECTGCSGKSTRRPGNSARPRRIFRNREETFSNECVNGKALSNEPKCVHVEAMTLLLVDETKPGASGWIFGVQRNPAGGHSLLDQSDANLFRQAIVAVPGGAEAGRTADFSFYFCFRSRRRSNIRNDEGPVLRQRRRRGPLGRRRFVSLLVARGVQQRSRGQRVLLRRRFVRRRSQVLLNDLQLLRFCGNIPPIVTTGTYEANERDRGRQLLTNAWLNERITEFTRCDSSARNNSFDFPLRRAFLRDPAVKFISLLQLFRSVE